MRILLFFDLPTLEKKDRKAANIFRRNLIKDGYHMVQLSVYGRVCKGLDSTEKHVNRVKAYAPSEGSVRILTVTERQYENMILIIGRRKKEEIINANQLVLL